MTVNIIFRGGVVIDRHGQLLHIVKMQRNALVDRFQQIFAFGDRRAEQIIGIPLHDEPEEKYAGQDDRKNQDRHDLKAHLVANTDTSTPHSSTHFLFLIFFLL